MLPELLISKFKSRIRSSLRSSSSLALEPELEPDSNLRLYLHSRRRYLINSIPLLSIVALLVILGISACPDVFHTTNSVYATEGYDIDPLAATAGLSVGNTKITGSTIPGGVAYASNTITATASDIGGYTLSITGPINLTGPTTLAGADGKSPSGIGSDAMLDNTWGYAYDQSTDDNAKVYSSFTGFAQTLESGTTPSGRAKNITFAAKFGENAISGHYMADIEISLVATPVTTTYTITYDANGGANAPASTTCVAQGEAGTSCAAILTSSEPTRTDYTFLGWSDSSTATAAQYAAGESITISGNKTVYAVWKANDGIWVLPDGTLNNAGIKNMQDIKSGFCKNNSNIPTPATKASVVPIITLRDKRDENSYTIAKLQDGNCWMVQNLRLINQTVSYDESDFTSGKFEIPAPDVSGFDSSDRLTNKAYFANNSAYYNWYTATAGAGTGDVSVTQSICPKQWTLPTGNSGQFANLMAAITGKSGNITDKELISVVMSAPYNFSKSGYVTEGKLLATANGHWWSRTAYGSMFKSYRLYIRADLIEPGSYWYRENGYAIRCIANY